jgi:iron(III) transport system permease protein
VNRRFPALLLALVLTWLVGYPLLLTLLEGLGEPGAWTLRYLADFAGRPDEWAALTASLWISTASVILAALFGVPLAFVFERTEFPGRRLLGGLVALPVALPPLVGVIAFLFLYGESGFVARAIQSLLGLDRAPWRLVGPSAILLVHAYSMYVYFYLFGRAALARLDRSMLEAAASLGAGPWTTFWRVTLPQLRPALLGATLLTFMTSLASFSAPYIFGGGFRVMTTQIVASKLNGDIKMAAVESVALASLAFVGLILLRRIDRGGVLALATHGEAPARRRPRTRRALVLATVAGWGLAAFLLLPHLTLALISLVPPATWTVETLPPVLGLDNYATLLSTPERLRPILNSLWMASAATAGALLLGFATARLAAHRNGLGRFLETLLAVPWAVPGTVFAVALATTFSVHQPLAGRFVLIGTPLILPLAYLVRSLPLTGRAAVAGLRQFDSSLEEAAASLGSGRLRTLWLIVLPRVRPALAAGATLALITALGDFVTSVVLYTFETRPISIEILSSLRLQEVGVAAAYGVLLMAASALIFTLWGRRGAI